MTSASLMHEAGHSKSVLWDNPEEYVGRGMWEEGIGMGEEGCGRRGSGWGDTCIPVADPC